MDNQYYFANLICQALAKLQDRNCSDLLSQAKAIQERSDQTAKQLRRLQMAMSRNWMGAAKRCRNLLEIALGDLPSRMSCLERFFARPEPAIPAIRDILAEMKQINDELGAIQFNRSQQTLSIITDSITLEDVYLGEFEICLDVSGIARMNYQQFYRVRALDPNPAAGNSEVTHPHISGEILCEGDGSAAIREALRQGRLFDFFDMIMRILKTYNPGSPYIRLEEWAGRSCHDCGRNCGHDGGYICRVCDSEYCEDCSSYCASCDETVCLGCSGDCDICGRRICQACSDTCNQCGKHGCSQCIENQLCDMCREENENEPDEYEDTEPIESSPAPVASVQPDGVGQAPLLPGPNQQ